MRGAAEVMADFTSEKPVISAGSRFCCLPDADSGATSARTECRARPGRRAKRAGSGAGRESKPVDPAIARIWREYRQTGAEALRNYLIVHYMSGHVRRIARTLHAHLPRQVDLDDLVQVGYAGLVAAMERFDLDEHVRFETFSSRRIHGAMVDYLRKLDPVPRLARARSKFYHAEVDQFRKEHGRLPSAGELHGRLDLPPRKFRRLLEDANPPVMVSFNSAGQSSAGGAGSTDDSDAMVGFEDHRAISPLSRAEREDLKRWVTRGFSRRDRLIIILYYYEQMTMKEVGRTLGCSESRVSQRLEGALQCLRARLRKTGAEREFE